MFKERPTTLHCVMYIKLSSVKWLFALIYLEDIDIVFASITPRNH